MFRATFKKILLQSHLSIFRKCCRKIIERTKQTTAIKNLLACLWSFNDAPQIFFFKIFFLLTEQADGFALASHLTCYQL